MPGKEGSCAKAPCWVWDRLAFMDVTKGFPAWENVRHSLRVEREMR